MFRPSLPTHRSKSCLQIWKAWTPPLRISQDIVIFWRRFFQLFNIALRFCWPLGLAIELLRDSEIIRRSRVCKDEQALFVLFYIFYISQANNGELEREWEWQRGREIERAERINPMLRVITDRKCTIKIWLEAHLRIIWNCIIKI